MRPPAPCPDCGGPLARRTRSATGEHGRARVSVQWPALVCPEGHRFHVHPEFGALFIVPFLDRLREAYTGALPQGVRRLLRRRPACPACGTALSRTPAGAIGVDVLADVPGVGPVEVSARLPTYRCVGCGQPAGWWAHADPEIVEAVTASIEAAGIRHLPRLRGRRPTHG